MTLLNRILRPGAKLGWTAVDAAPDGLFGVTVMAPAEVGGRPMVASCGSVAGGGLDLQSLVRLGASISVGGCSWTLPLDRKAYSILVIEEPAVRAEEMEQSVRWAVSTMVDYAIDDAFVAWMKIPTSKLLPNRAPHLYVIVARSETVNSHRELFKQAKLPLGAIDVQETAHRNIAALVAKPGEGVALLAVSKRGMQLTITFDGELYLDRHIDENIFSDSIDEAGKERARERVVLQVQRSLDFVGRTLPFIDIQRLVLAPMPSEGNLAGQITENLSVAVEPLDLGKIFDFSRAAQLQNKESHVDYFVALGAALRFWGKSP